MVTRIEALRRASSIWSPGTVPYSQVLRHQPDGYRQDCSGYVSMCWAIPSSPWGGENTESLVTEGWMSEVPADQLQPGDAIGMCGPGTLGDAGHVQLFEAWTAGGGLVIWEQAGGTVGPTRRTIKRITPGYRAYRFRGFDTPEEIDMTPEERNWLHNAVAITTGLANGADSVQCRYAWEGDGHQIGDTFQQSLAPFWARVAKGGSAGGVSHDELVQAAFEGAQRAEKE